MSSVTENALKQKSLMGYLKDSREFVRLKSEVASGAQIINVGGLTSVSSKALVLAALQKELNKTLVVVTASNQESEAFVSDIEFFSDGTQAILALPSSESDPYSGTSPHSETLEVRALTLWQMSHGAPDILVLPVRSLVTRVAPPEELRAMSVDLERDKDFPTGVLIGKLAASCSVREDPLQKFGQFSLRGGIIDVWPPNAGAPVRIEFFGDSVDSIREFDVETQLST